MAWGYDVLGLVDYVLVGYYDKGDATLGHELGHYFGYNHSSNMTYPSEFGGRLHGPAEITRQLWDELLETNDLPVLKKDYYKQTDFN